MILKILNDLSKSSYKKVKIKINSSLPQRLKVIQLEDFTDC